MAENAAGIAQPVGILRGGRVEKNSHGLLRLRAEDHHPSKNFVRLARVSVDVEDAPRAVSIGVHQDFVDHGI